MNKRKIIKKKELKEKIFKLTSILLIANLVVGGFFINAPQALADTTGTLQTVDGDGTYTDWINGESVIDETSGFACTSNDSIKASETGERESFNISLSSIPNGRIITSVSVTVRDRGHNDPEGKYRTFVRLNGTNTDASANLSATGDSGSCSAEKTQILDVADTVKSGATTLEIGVVKTSPVSEMVRVGTVTAVVTYSDADTTVPVITLIDPDLINVAVGDIYVDAGATASDDVDGDITENILTF